MCAQAEHVSAHRTFSGVGLAYTLPSAQAGAPSWGSCVRPGCGFYGFYGFYGFFDSLRTEKSERKHV